jgi:two-component system sensor histidine kinase PilS (NtrC family)
VSAASATRAEGPAAAPGEVREAGDGLHRKLVWLTLFRLGTVTVLLGGTAVVNWELGAQASQVVAPLYAVIAITYGASLILASLLRARVLERAVAFAQIALDIGIAAAVVAATGTSDSVFVFMFLLAIVNGAIVLYRTGAVVATVLALPCYVGLVAWLHAPLQQVRATLFVHGSAFVVTAALASYLAEQLRRTGERLAESESDLAAVTALHESIVQSVTSGLVTLDPRGRITFLNRAGEALTGLSLVQVRGEPGERWFPAFSREARGETEFVNARGERRLLGYTVFDLHATEGRTGPKAGTAVIFQDLTELRAMQEVVERSKRLADLGEVAAGLAHELRNPLASISGCVELLRAVEGLSPEDQRVLGIVLRETARLDALLGRFLAFSRPARPQPRPVDLAALLGETLDVFAGDATAAGVAIERALAPTPAVCDADQLRQVAWNLLANAAQAIRESGKGTRIRVTCAPEPGGAATLAVEDDGPGMSEAQRERVFTPFFTTKAKGTGLGLAVVHRIVDAHGGSVAVHSRPGEGARFVVRLPASAPAAGSAPEPHPG